MRQELEKIIQLQKDMGYYELTQSSEHFKWDYIRDITLATHVELSEFLQEVPWKPWVKAEDVVYDSKKAAGELMDVFVFNLVLWATLNPEINIDEMFKQTVEKIQNRIKENDYGNNS